MKSYNCLKLIKNISLLLLFTFILSSCDALGEALENGLIAYGESQKQTTSSSSYSSTKYNSTSKSNTCHTAWVGTWMGTSATKDFTYGKNGQVPITLKISFNSKVGKLNVSASGRSYSPDIKIYGTSLGYCSSSTYSGTYNASVSFKTSLSKSGKTIKGTIYQYSNDNSGKKHLRMSSQFTVTKQ